MNRGYLAHRGVTALLLVILISTAETAFGQTVEQAAPPSATEAATPPAATPGELLSTAGKLRLAFEGFLGFGVDSNKVGVTTGGEDVKISGGGGVGLGVTMGYGLSRDFDIEGTLGVQTSGLQPAVDNADGSFDRSFVLATVKYKIPVRENLQWKFGVGAGYYQGELDIDIDPGVPGAGHTVVDYKNALGVHATAELEIALRERLALSVGLKYYQVTYDAESASFNGVSQSVSSLKDEYREFNGDGVDITVGLGVLF